MARSMLPMKSGFLHFFPYFFLGGRWKYPCQETSSYLPRISSFKPRKQKWRTWRKRACGRGARYSHCRKQNVISDVDLERVWEALIEIIPRQGGVGTDVFPGDGTQEWTQVQMYKNCQKRPRLCKTDRFSMCPITIDEQKEYEIDAPMVDAW